jgi:chemotaxis protein MotA
VAFVATVYGVASANILFLPAAQKLKARTEKMIQTQELMLEGVSCILQGLHPEIIEAKLTAYAKETKKSRRQESTELGQAAREAVR